jgi:hypothetical protein
LLDGFRGLRLDDPEGVVIAGIHTEHTTLTGVWIDGDGEEAAGTGLVFSRWSIVGLGEGELEVTHLLLEPSEFLGQSFLGFPLASAMVSAMASSRSGR